MKSFSEVEETRRTYHQDRTRNSVHSASLTVPELPDSKAEITFVNHFLLKRGYTNVACRVTAVDAVGKRIESRLYEVVEPKVYTIPLSGMADTDATSYLIDFFASDNLFIPFPAVMVNHVGANFLNSVHAYNRVLNDVFEDDAINARSVREASICMACAEGAETVAVIAAGMLRLRGNVDFEVLLPDQVLRTSVPVDLPRFGHQTVSINSLFEELGEGARGILKIHQPSQFMFYGRLLTGQRKGSAFSFNHSYYDSSETEEYWNTKLPSERQYPFFPALNNRIRMYPIMSPGRIDISIKLIGENGQLLKTISAGSLESPGTSFLDIDINKLAADAHIEASGLSSFAVCAGGERVPTRVNHQLVHSLGGLEASVNVSLFSPNVFQPKEKTGLCWGQIPIDDDLNSWVGFVGGMASGSDAELEVIFYDAVGELARRSWPLKGAGAIRFNARLELARELTGRPAGASRYVWYMARSRRSDISGFVVAHQLNTNNCCGEHSF